MRNLTKAFALAYLIVALVSCKKTEPEVPPVVKPPVVVHKTEYLKLLPETATNLTITQKADYHYILQTNKQDPYISTGKLTKKNHTDSVVLCFEYKSNKDLDFIQAFFADPVSEERSYKTEKVPAASDWKKYSVVLKTKLLSTGWGSVGNYLRLDFGNEAGYTIELKNIYFRGMNAAEKQEEEDKAQQLENHKAFAESIRKYLDTNYTSNITQVKANDNTIEVKGKYVGDGEFILCEVPPYADLTKIKQFEFTKQLSSSTFTESFDRFVIRDGIKYDRTLSKWLIVKKSSQTIASHARYADVINAKQAMVKQNPSSKKGLGGCFNHGIQQQDLLDLGITSVTVNIAFTEFMFSTPGSGRILHTYGGKNYYFDENRLASTDAALKECSKRNIVASAIILVHNAAVSADPAIGAILQHPDYSGGYYTMPNMTTHESVNTYAAALDFLANRYCRTDNLYGRIHHWIMHNEVDAGLEWTNMGRNKPMLMYLDTYMKSMRMCYNIVRRYDGNSEVFGSFTHSWSKPLSSDYYATLDMLNAINDYCKAEGDFQWALAFHSYPQDLNEPKTWNDTDATYSTKSGLVTFKNLEVLNHWVKQASNYYKGTVKRTVWLSENGTNSKTYEQNDLKEQAAGFAWAWKKINQLDGIDAIQWHNWADNEAEFGLRIGLRKFSSHGLEAKPVWFAYKAAGTPDENNIFNQYLSTIGISDWNIIKPVY